MKFESNFVEIPLEELRREAAVRKADGWRFVQTHAVNTESGVDLYYSFMKDGHLQNLKVCGVAKGQAVPSITDLFLAAFVFENEARELFGVDMRDIAIDFAGAMYSPAESEPMTFISPEQKALREKARKAAAAKAAKAAKEAQAASDATAGTAQPQQDGSKAAASGGFVMTPERRARLDAKLATMSPEKVAKVEAALAALKDKQPASTDASAQAAGNGKPAAAVPAEKPADSPAAAEKAQTPSIVDAADEQLEALIGLMDSDAAAKVRDALSSKEGE